MKIALTIVFIIIAIALAILVLSQEGKDRILTLDPVDIEFNDLTVKLQTKIHFLEGSSSIRVERNILSMTDPDAEVIIKEYITACYGTTEYPEDMTGILLSVTDGEKTEKIEYEYKCREAFVDGAKEAKAVVNAIDTEVTLTTDVKVIMISVTISDCSFMLTQCTLDKM